MGNGLHLWYPLGLERHILLFSINNNYVKIHFYTYEILSLISYYMIKLLIIKSLQKYMGSKQELLSF